MRTKITYLFCILNIYTYFNLKAQELNWAVGFGIHSGTNPGSAFRQDHEDNVYFLDRSYAITDLDPGPDVFQVDPGYNGMTLSKFSESGQFINGMALSGTADYFCSLDIDLNGNIYIIGNFTSCDFDPSPNEYIVESNSGADLFIAKYDSDLNLVWVRTFGNNVIYQSIYGQDLRLDIDQNILATGYFTESFDADPSEEELILNTQNYDGYFLKLNPDGDLIFAKSMQSTQGCDITTIDRDLENNIVIVGNHTSPVNIDPGISDYTVDPANFESVNRFYAKYTPEGSLIWAHSIANLYQPWGYSKVAMDENNSIYSIGYFSTSTDFDPGPNEAIFTSNNISYFILKTSSDGDFQWAQSFDSDNISINCIATDETGNLVISGYGGGDIDPGPGIDYLISQNAGDSDIFIAQFDSNDGHYLSSFTIQSAGNNSDWTYDIVVNSQNHAIINGLFQNDIDVDPGVDEFILEYQGLPRVLIASYTLDICNSLDIEIVAASDINCTNQEGLVEFEINNGEAPFQITWSEGSSNVYSINPQNPGFYGVTVVDNSGCDKTRNAFLDGPASISASDLEVSLFSLNNFHPGLEITVQLLGFNNGCLEEAGLLQLQFSELLSVVATNPPADYVNTGVVNWTFDELSYDGTDFSPTVTFLVPADESLLGELVNFEASIQPEFTDIDFSNNIKYYQFEITGPYDPNDKQVHPSGIGEEGLIENNQTMTYTVRFQNTGTAPAVNVRIEDVIDTDLDLASLNILSSSHVMFVEVLDNNTLNFHFNNIMLPDSNANEPESHGYVIFSLEQQQDLLPGTQITNTAAIYFDFNSPIITNTVLNTIIDPDGIAENRVVNNGLTLYPNPAQDVLVIELESEISGIAEIFNIEGKIVQSARINNKRETVNVESLQSGLYMIRILTNGGAVNVARFVKE